MSDLRDAPSATPRSAAQAACAGYRAQLLYDVRVGPGGLRFGTAGGERTLAWDEVWFAVAAEVGEPEGVRAIVFDLVVGRDAGGWRVLRLDAELGPFAEQIARAIQAGLPRERRGPSIKSLASDGVPSQWYADLESFEESVAAAVAGGRP
jgi:hypothetical protein